MGKTALFRRLKWAARKACSSVAMPAPDFLNRRTFLKSSAALAALAVPLSPTRGSGGMRTVILGAGISGLGAAVKLRDYGMEYQIFEASPRIGGRIWTAGSFNVDGQFAEFGGELIDSNHATIVAWARGFGLELESFEGRAQAQSEEMYYFGGQRYDSEDLSESLRPLAQFCRRAFAEMRTGIDRSVYLGHQQRHHPGVLKYDRMSLSDFLDAVPGLDTWIKRVIDVGYVCEFGLEAGAQTSINLLELFDPEMPGDLFGSSDESLRIKGGNSRLLEKMFERACAFGSPGRSGNRVYLNHELVRIRDRGRKIDLTFRSGLSEKTVSADRVICTIPFSVLRRIDGVARLPLSKVKKRSILELGYGTNSKVTMNFQKRFWKESAVSTSATLFCDLPSQSYWESTRGQGGARGILTNFRGGRAGESVSQAAMTSNIKDLGEMFDGPAARDQFENGVVNNWLQMPYQRGSYSCMMPGQTTRCWGNNHVPELDGRLVFAGEHTSLEAVGYMEGALTSGIRAARQIRNSVSF